jgi:hypothetical protein
MRWLFLFVLSLNLAYIGLEMSRSSAAGYTDVPALKNVQKIVLLSELKQSSNPAPVEQAGVGGETADELVENSPIKQGDRKAVQMEIESVHAGASVSATPVAKPPAVKSAARLTETASAPVVQQPSTEKLVVKAPAGAGQDVSGKSPQLTPAQSMSCFTLGPFRDLTRLRGLTREIKSYVTKADFRGREEKEQPLYWVYVKPEKNRAQAIKTGKRLKAGKIKDFYVIRDGEKINGLSLGYFRNKTSAYGLAKKVKRFGFDVIVEPVFKTYTIYWLDYQLAGGVIIPDSILEKYTRPTKKQRVSRLPRDCGV